MGLFHKSEIKNKNRNLEEFIKLKIKKDKSIFEYVNHQGKILLLEKNKYNTIYLYDDNLRSMVLGAYIEDENEFVGYLKDFFYGFKNTKYIDYSKKIFNEKQKESS